MKRVIIILLVVLLLCTVGCKNFISLIKDSKSTADSQLGKKTTSLESESEVITVETTKEKINPPEFLDFGLIYDKLLEKGTLLDLATLFESEDNLEIENNEIDNELEMQSINFENQFVGGLMSKPMVSKTISAEGDYNLNNVTVTYYYSDNDYLEPQQLEEIIDSTLSRDFDENHNDEYLSFSNSDNDLKAKVYKGKYFIRIYFDLELSE